MSTPRSPISEEALKRLFLEARSYRTWSPGTVSEDQIRRLYEIAKLGPTSLNSCPGRFVWVASDAGKQALAACVKEGNAAKILAASVTVVVGYDTKFYKQSDRLAPHVATLIQAICEADPAEAYDTAYRNSALQGAYLIMAARACGLDVGPISGFYHDKVNDLYFKGTDMRANFLCCIGYGREADLRPRNTRLSFEEVNRFV